MLRWASEHGCHASFAGIVGRASADRMVAYRDEIDPEVPLYGQVPKLEAVTEGVAARAAADAGMDGWVANKADTMPYMRQDGRLEARGHQLRTGFAAFA